jgi:hypothetical protein
VDLIRRIRDLWRKGRRNPADDAQATPDPSRPAPPIGSEASDPVEACLLWSVQTVWPALRRLAESNLFLWSPLNRIALTLPKQEREAWYAVLKEMRQTQSRLLEYPAAPLGSVFVRLVKVLNERWFIPRQILFACLPREVGPQIDVNIWKAAAVVVCRIAGQRCWSFRDAGVPLYEVAMVFPPGAHYQKATVLAKNFYDPTSEWAVIDLDYWKTQILHHLSLTDERYRNYLLRTDPDVLRITAQSGAAMKRAFASPFALYEAMLWRAMFEEVRHGIDGKRILLEAPQAFLTSEYYARVAKVLLPPGGRLCREVCDPAATGPAGEADGRQTQAARTVLEVSAQLTASAVSPVPQLVLLEWKERTAKVCLEFNQGAVPRRERFAAPHEAAARIAIILLAEQLGLTSPLDFGAASRSDYERLDSLAESLFRQSPEALRLALKEIYRREFVYNQIDEFPFPGIGANGEYIPVREPPNDLALAKADNLLWPTSSKQS